MKSILIIGAGVSGVSLLKHLIMNEHFEGNYLVDVVDERENLGRGFAYIKDDDVLLTNVPVEHMSLDSNPLHFKGWLDQKGLFHNRFVSRNVFGEYMNTIFRELTKKNGVHIIEDYVENIVYQNDTFNVHFGKTTRSYDYVYMGIGVMEYIDPYELRGKKNFIYNPYPISERLSDVDGNVTIIGSSLSAIDCIRYFLMVRNMNKVTVFSRDNEMPSVRGKYQEFTFKHFTPESLDDLKARGEFTLENLTELFVQELKTQEIDMALFKRRTQNIKRDLIYDLMHKEAVGKLQYFLVHYNKILTDYLDDLPKEDQEKMFEKYQPYISENYSPMPHEVAIKLIEWIDSGRLVIIDDIEAISKKDTFMLHTSDNHHTTDWVINATGPNTDITTARHTLIRNLYESKMIEPHNIGGFRVNQKYQIVSPKHGVFNRFFALGEQTTGTTYLSNAVSDMYRLTERVAKRILD